MDSPWWRGKTSRLPKCEEGGSLKRIVTNVQLSANSLWGVLTKAKREYTLSR